MTSMRELKLRYVIELVSNLGGKARQDAQVVEDAARREVAAFQKAEKAATDLGSDVAQVGVQAKKQAQQVEDASRRFVGAMGRAERSTVSLETRVRAMTANSGLERHANYVERMAAGYERARTAAGRLKDHAANLADRAPEVAMAVGAGYYAGSRMMGPPLRAYSDLETATTDLKVAMMDSTGKVSEAFAKIAAEAESLGNQLPGTTKDFMAGARALVEQGTPGSVIAGGGLRASSYFGLLANMDQAAAAETIAKMREAYGLKDNELVGMADLMQRGRYAFGINPTDYRMVASYAAPTYNAFGLTGMDNAKKLLAVQGMAASVGLESSSFGTNFSQMLMRLSQIDGRTGRNSAEAKAVRALLAENGIEMSFYGKDGQFSGIENMLKELSKLRAVNPLEQQKALNLMFGVEAGRPAQILMQQGLEKYQANLQLIDNQADIYMRVAEKVDTFGARLDALGGTFESTLAKMAAPVGEVLKPAISVTNDIVGRAGQFFEENPAVGGSALLGLGAGSSYLAVRSAGWLRDTLRGGGRIPAGQVPPISYPGLFEAERAATKASVARWSGIGSKALPLAGFGLESYGVLTDETLTAEGKARGVMSAGVGGLTGWGGAWAGAAVGGAAGSVVPVIGNIVGAVIGGLLGGLGGYTGGKWLFDQARPFNPDTDLVRVSAPNGATITPSIGGGTTVQLGEGLLRLEVKVSDDRSSVVPTLAQPLSLIRIDAGNTNPGGFNIGGGF